MLRFLMKSCPFLKLLKLSFSFITQSDQKLDHSWTFFFSLFYEGRLWAYSPAIMESTLSISFMVNGYLAISCISESRQDIYFLYFHLDLLSTENASFSLILWEKVLCNFLIFRGSFYFLPPSSLTQKHSAVNQSLFLRTVYET